MHIFTAIMIDISPLVLNDYEMLSLLFSINRSIKCRFFHCGVVCVGFVSFCLSGVSEVFCFSNII